MSLQSLVGEISIPLMKIPSFSQALTENLWFQLEATPPPAPLSSELLGSIWRDGGSPSPSQLSVPRPKSSPGFLQSTQRAAKCPNSAKGSWKWISNGKADQSAPSRLSRHLNAPPPPAQRNLAVPNSLLRVAKSAFLIHGGLYL
jgi:hypothetical protein